MQLSFTYTFDHGGDETFCCYTIPYTYSDMKLHLEKVQRAQRHEETKIVKIESIGKSLGGLNIPILKIQSKPDLPIVFIIGRQHSGETYSSFVIHGLINFLLGPEEKARDLRESYAWWICPMVNPDGAVIGNYRTNL